MKKQEYIDLGLSMWLSLSQIESVLIWIMWISSEAFFRLTDISSKYIYEAQKIFYDIKNGAPEEYTLWIANFYGRDFYVDERVLIPRNDTEVLVSKATQHINTKINPSQYAYIDVGTGSACIPVSIIKEIYPLSFSRSFVSDISQQALEVAGKNLEKHKLENLEILHANLLEGLVHIADFSEKNLFITANLPYIKNGDHENMDRSVIQHEPDNALYGWKNSGFELYEELIKQCFSIKKVLKLKNIVLIIEIGFDQKEISQEFLWELWLIFEYFTDTANIDRVIVISGF